MPKHIILVEDDPHIRENYIDLLTKQGYRVDGYGSRSKAEAAFRAKLPDMAILDIGLNDEPAGGYDLCRFLRSESAVMPIIFLTARDSDMDEVLGLRLGADDYLTKDVSLHQLLARVSGLFRRVDAIAGKGDKEIVVSTAELEINIDRLIATWKGKSLGLTVTEIWILNSLAKNPGHIRTLDQLMHAANANAHVDDGTIRSHIKRIRQKFEAVDDSFDAIKSKYGAGYFWEA